MANRSGEINNVLLERKIEPFVNSIKNENGEKDYFFVFGEEDLQVRNMSRSAAGSIEEPGRNVKAKSGLNKSILDQGWFEFRRQLEYKLGWTGGELLTVPPHNTSRTCPCCGHVDKDNRLSQARFECVSCSYESNADVVGAINILRAGQARLACGESVQSGHSVKQEPTEVTNQELALA